jgi:tetratricopeptide (TPR) repeat protein
MRKKVVAIILIVICLVEAGFLIYQIPAVHDRLSWRLDELQAEIKGYLYPHPQSIATPDQARAAMMQASLTAARMTGIAPTSTPGPTEADLPTVTPTATKKQLSLPASAMLPFERHEWQGYNNCGPATLSMDLHFWGWEGDQNITASYLKPSHDDKNVMPYEIERFVLDKTKYGIYVRTGGTLDDLRSLIAAGFPVIIEKGLEVAARDLGWMGHYDFVTGYFDDKRTFLTQDSYLGPNHTVDYDSLMYDWRAFNFVYLVVYPKDKEQDVARILGSNADLPANQTNTLNLALGETQTLTGQSLAYAYFNLGSAHVSRLEYVDAAFAYDMARYQGLPWRFLWYQTGPYFAYYYAGRYQDVIDLATATLYVQENLEESWYWRGMARMKLGDRQGAIDDWRQALLKHPGFAPALEQLSQIGETA